MVLEMEMSKTYQYRKVMKPMLERKRRARINKCLDELKEIMVECLTQEGEHITRLEKADILELTVEHMKKLKQHKQLRICNTINNQDNQKMSIAESFRSGYVHAANEVSKALSTVSGVNVDLGSQLMSHLGHRLNYLQVIVPSSTTTITNANNNNLFKSSQSLGIFPQLQLQSPTAMQTTQNVTVASAPSHLESITTGGSNFFEDNNCNNCHQQSQSPSSIMITPPPSECCSDRSSTSPTPSESNSVWRPW